MTPSWSTPPADLKLTQNDVHVWRAVLDVPDRCAKEFEEALSFDEKIRADRFRFKRDKYRFIAAHGILRIILSRYLSIEPRAIRFCFDKNGKPRLSKQFEKSNIQFNLSHSETLALYVFSHGFEVGIDVEYIHDIPDMEQIVSQLFSYRERSFFGTLSENNKTKTFFNWWTRKEAFTKAIGDGLSYPLNTFYALPSIEDSSYGPLRLHADGPDGRRWTIWDIWPAQEFVGAIATEANEPDFQNWQWHN